MAHITPNSHYRLPHSDHSVSFKTQPGSSLIGVYLYFDNAPFHIGQYDPASHAWWHLGDSGERDFIDHKTLYAHHQHHFDAHSFHYADLIELTAISEAFSNERKARFLQLAKEGRTLSA